MDDKEKIKELEKKIAELERKLIDLEPVKDSYLDSVCSYNSRTYVAYGNTIREI